MRRGWARRGALIGLYPLLGVHAWISCSGDGGGAVVPEGRHHSLLGPPCSQRPASYLGSVCSVLGLGGQVGCGGGVHLYRWRRGGVERGGGGKAQAAAGARGGGDLRAAKEQQGNTQGARTIHAAGARQRGDKGPRGCVPSPTLGGQELGCRSGRWLHFLRRSVGWCGCKIRVHTPRSGVVRWACLGPMAPRTGVSSGDRGY
jgi:hypothetical protein